MTRARVNLWGLIWSVLYRQARALLAELNDDEHGRAVHDEIAADIADLVEHADPRRPGCRFRFRWAWDDAPRERERARSLVVAVDIVTREGVPAPLLTVRVRDLLDNHGAPVDATATMRELSASLGLDRVPDDPGALIDAQRPAQGQESGGPITPEDVDSAVERYRAYLGCAVAALLRPASEPLACCTGRGDRELSEAHEDAHVLADAWRHRSADDREMYRAILIAELRTLRGAA